MVFCGGATVERAAPACGEERADTNWPAKIGNTPVVTNFDDWRAGKGVLRCNWRRFKGLEADAIVLTQSDRFLPPESDRYVATSRAKHLLTVVSIGQ